MLKICGWKIRPQTGSVPDIYHAYPLACDYIILTNGEETVVAAWDFEKEQYRDIKNVPVYDEMIKNLHQWLEE